MGIILTLLGLVAALAGGIWIIVLTFRTSILWGLASLLIPVVALIFSIMHWEDAKRPFLIYVAGIVLMIVGAVLSGPPPAPSH